MSGTDPHRCGEDVAAYALGALEGEEARTMARHLDTCAVCHDELRSFEQVVDELALTLPRYKAPPELRRRVVRAIADEPRLDRPASLRRRFSMPRPAFALGGVAAVAAAAVVVLVLVLTSGGGGGAGSHTRLVTAKVAGRGTAQVRVSSGHAELVVRGFPAPPKGKIYEVWLKRATGNPIPTTALFGVTGHGEGNVDVPGSLHGVQDVLVTPEPLGGSTTPTHTPVIVAALD